MFRQNLNIGFHFYEMQNIYLALTMLLPTKTTLELPLGVAAGV